MLWPLAWFYHFVILFRFGLTTQRFISCTFLYENCISWIYVLNSTSFAFALVFFLCLQFFFFILLCFALILHNVLVAAFNKKKNTYFLCFLFFVTIIFFVFVLFSNWFFVVVVSFGEKRKMFNYFYSEHSHTNLEPNWKKKL